jgi:hypothetical protein
MASISMGWVDDFVERSGLPSGTILNVVDGQGVVQYRSVDHEK